MPKIDAAERREYKQRKAKSGMVVTNRSIFTLQDVIHKKAKEAAEKLNEFQRGTKKTP